MKRIVRDHDEQLHTNNLDNLEETDKFLETYNLPRLNHEEKENLNKPITSKKTESVAAHPQRKTLDQMALLENSIKYLMKN